MAGATPKENSWVRLDYCLGAAVSSFFIVSCFILSFFMLSFFVLVLFTLALFFAPLVGVAVLVVSCFMLSLLASDPVCAKAARETARKHRAINLAISFFILPPKGWVGIELRPHYCGCAWDLPMAQKLQRTGKNFNHFYVRMTRPAWQISWARPLLAGGRTGVTGVVQPV